MFKYYFNIYQWFGSGVLKKIIIEMYLFVGADSLVGSVPTYGAIALQVSRDRIPPRGPFPFPPPISRSHSLPVISLLSCQGKCKMPRKKRKCIYSTVLSVSQIWLADSLFQVCDIPVITALQPFHRLFHSACRISHIECHGGHPNPL